MKITVIIPTKNRAKDLLVAVNSVINQTAIPDELVIVDQSETSHSEVAIKSLVEETTLKLIYIYDTSISGLVHAKQIGVKNSSGAVVCFLEDDIELEPSYIDAMDKAFAEKPCMMGCCGVVTNLPKLSSAYALFFHLFHRGIFFDNRVGVHGFTQKLNDKLIPSKYLSGGTSAFRRSVFDVIKFDVSNKFHMLEDIDFSMRAASHYGNNSFFINPKARLAHYMSPVNRDLVEARYCRKMREFLIFYKKNSVGFYDLICLIWLLIGQFIEAFLTTMKHRSFAPIRGFFTGITAGLDHKLIDVN